MDARTGLVIGGLAAVTASVAVVTAVAFANTMALADSPGATVASGHILVPAAAAPETVVDETPASTDQPETTSPGAEVVQAPDPLVVAPPAAATGETPREQVVDTVPSTGGANTPAAPEKSLDQVIAEAKASGSWDPIRNWAAANGWSHGRLDALIARLERERAAEKAAEDQRQSADSDGARLDGSTATDSQRDLVATKPDKKQQPGGNAGSQRPAHAGSNVGHGHGADADAKKDRSRDSPDRRD